MSQLRCEIVTQERLVFDKMVDMVIAPGSEGELGILPHHVPLITALNAGELRVKIEQQEETFAISGGFMEVGADGVTVLARTAEHAQEIDIARAAAARERAEQLLKEGPPPEGQDLAALESALRRSHIRLKVARRRQRRPGPSAMMETDHE